MIIQNVHIKNFSLEIHILNMPWLISRKDIKFFENLLKLDQQKSQ